MTLDSEELKKMSMQIRLDALKEVLAAIHRYLILSAGFGIASGLLFLPGIFSSVSFSGLELTNSFVAGLLSAGGYFVTAAVASMFISRAEWLITDLKDYKDLIPPILAFPSIASIAKPGYRLGIVMFPPILLVAGLVAHIIAKFDLKEGLGGLGFLFVFLVSPGITLSSQLWRPLGGILPSGGDGEKNYKTPTGVQPDRQNDATLPDS